MNKINKLPFEQIPKIIQMQGAQGSSAIVLINQFEFKNYNDRYIYNTLEFVFSLIN